MPRLLPNEIIHAEDQSALHALESVPLFPEAVKAFMKALPEDMLAGLNLVQKIRLGPKQLPRIYEMLPPICSKLGIAEPELFLEMNPEPNAYTFGDTRTFITVTSGLLDYLDEGEIRVVIAHECGHIFARHVLYHTMADFLLRGGMDFLGIAGVFTIPLRAAFCYWSRRSELTADRVAALVSGGADEVVETMIRLSGGPKRITGEIDKELYMAQASEFSAHTSSKWSALLQNFAAMETDHPWPVLRAAEIHRWTDSEQFKRLSNGMSRQEMSCRSCGSGVDKLWNYCLRCGAAVKAEAQ